MYFTMTNKAAVTLNAFVFHVFKKLVGKIAFLQISEIILGD